MTRSASLEFVLKLKGVLANVLASGSTIKPAATHELKQAGKYLTGTGANQVDRVWGDDDRSLAEDASETFDLFDFAGADIGAGAGLDALGQSMSLAEVVAIMIVNKSTSTGRLVVGNDGTTAAFQAPFKDSGTPDDAAISIAPGGVFVLTDPNNPAMAVVDVNDHLLKLEALGGDVDYAIIIAGRSA